jgi:imidazolonepropionase-like amidohydrolase
MKSILYIVLVVLALAGIGGAYNAYSIGFLYISFKKPYVVKKSPELHPENTLVAFTNVSVVPMDEERILEDQTVIVRDGVIESILPSEEISVPDGAMIVGGRGKTLMPGLVDMHVHIEEENELLLFVAHGVTTVRNMWGSSGVKLWLGFADQLDLREKINAGKLFGPTIYTSGPVLEGTPPTTPFMMVVETAEEARKQVFEQVEAGYDFIKVYDYLKPEVYTAVIETAEELGIPVIGHVPFQVGLDGVLESGQVSIEHQTGYLDPDAVELNILEDRIEDYVEKSRESGVWVVPTIVLYQHTVPVDAIESMEARPEMRTISPRMKRIWRMFTRTLEEAHTYKGSDYPGDMVALSKRMVGELHAGGVRLLLGTDTDNAYLVPGLSVHEELQLLVEAGLSPYEALLAGTREAAEALGVLEAFGTVEEGKRADLILVEGNPLEEVANASRRVGVMLRGHWLPEAQLGEILDELAESYTPTLLGRFWLLGLVALVGLVARRVWMNRAA